MYVLLIIVKVKTVMKVIMGDECDWKELLTDEAFLEMQNSDFLSGSFQFSDIDEDVGQASYPVQLDPILNDVNMNEIDNH